jgi:hypothetical protein
MDRRRGDEGKDKTVSGAGLSRRDFLKAAACLGTAALVRDNGTADLVCEGDTVKTKGPFKPLVKVEPILGVPTFTVDGVPWLQPMYEAFTHGRPVYYEDFAQAGTRLFCVTTNNGRDHYGRSQDTRPTPDTWEFSELDEHARRAIKTHSDSLLIFRTYVDTPRWWLEQNPDELELFENGKPTPPETESRGYWRTGPYPSIASKKWREDMGEGLAKVIQHIQASDYSHRVFGYMLVGLRTEEWYQWTLGAPVRNGYSQPTTKAFRSWLRRKYGTLDAFQAAWRDLTVDFASALVPAKHEREDRDGDALRNPATSMKVVDFYLFWNELVSETIDHFAAVVKGTTKGSKVCGAFHGLLYELRDPEGGTNDLGRYLSSDNLDFVIATAGYKDRGFGSGCDYERAPTHSVTLHGKLWIHDNDLTTHVTGEIARQRIADRRGVPVSTVTDDEIRDAMGWALSEYGHTETPQKSIWMQRRAAGFALCHRMNETFFDLQPGWYNSPEMMAEVERLNRMWERAAEHDRSSNSQILVVADDESACYCTYRSLLLDRSLVFPQFRLTKLGAPVDQILLDDLAITPLDHYRLIIFLNTYSLKDSHRTVIEQRVKGDGRTLLWCYAPGIFRDASMDPQFMRDVTGLQLELSPDGIPIEPQIHVGESSHPVAVALRRQGFRVLGSSRFADVDGNESEMPRAYCRLISADDPDAATLGVLPGTDKTTLAVKEIGSWRSVYAITQDLPPAFYRELARYAGVHIWSEKDDTFYANKSYVCLHANGAGQRTILFPRRCELWDAITEDPLAKGTDEFTRHFEHGETIILRWQ